MKYSNRIKSLLLTLSAIATTVLINTPQTKAQTVSFQEQQVNQEQFNVVAVPFGYQEHRLEILEQIPGKQQCWAESGAIPIEVDLLLLNFDHTASCRRFINTNGYTLRINGEDETVAHIIKIVPNGSELQLVAIHKDPSQPSMIIGSTNGLSDKAMKITLNPGWQITKRVHQGKIIDHLYISSNLGTTTNNYSANSSIPIPTPGTVPPLQSVDTKALVNGVEQIYNNVLTPLLYNLSQGSNDSQN